MPAAAVIPAPIAYANVVAVKRLVVELLTLVNTVHSLVVCRTVLFLVHGSTIF